MFEEEEQRVNATEAWLHYLQVCPKSDIDIYDLHALGYSFVEVRDILVKSAASGEEIRKEHIAQRAEDLKKNAPLPQILG